MISKNLKEKGVTIHSKAQLERLEQKNGKVEYELSYKDGSREVIEVDKALLSWLKKRGLMPVSIKNFRLTLD